MAETAVTAEPDAGTTPAAIAARHGLTVAGARPGLGAYARQLWAYRHFISAYANARVIAQFSTAKLGRIWQVLTPITNALVYYLIFGIILKADGGEPNFIGYLCAGVFIFTFTSSVVTAGIQAISGNLGIIRALHFPRASLPLALAMVQFQHLVASMLVLAGIMLVTGEPLTFEWLLVLPALLLQSVFNAGLALAMARLGAKLTDLRQVMPFILRTWMYASAVLYPVTLFKDHLPPWAADLLELNPLLVYIELMRHAMMSEVSLSSPIGQIWALAAGWALLVGAGGFIYFWRGEQEYGRG
ncbi:transport permease protein [Pilimelia terevasa]|uniref:Transport permease protein n=1 Tax=Pilimelia terevasa TaxID=53372 RepID=A0A8J3BLF7_9ACTN|nr:ABC transporter permease [Pilimelia terevasa]GGK12308.1 transport permease protein [Pilimelia terevasa]